MIITRITHYGHHNHTCDVDVFKPYLTSSHLEDDILFKAAMMLETEGKTRLTRPCALRVKVMALLRAMVSSQTQCCWRECTRWVRKHRRLAVVDDVPHRLGQEHTTHVARPRRVVSP